MDRRHRSDTNAPGDVGTRQRTGSSAHKRRKRDDAAEVSGGAEAPGNAAEPDRTTHPSTARSHSTSGIRAPWGIPDGYANAFASAAASSPTPTLRSNDLFRNPALQNLQRLLAQGPVPPPPLPVQQLLASALGAAPVPATAHPHQLRMGHRPHHRGWEEEGTNITASAAAAQAAAQARLLLSPSVSASLLAAALNYPNERGVVAPFGLEQQQSEDLLSIAVRRGLEGPFPLQLPTPMRPAMPNPLFYSGAAGGGIGATPWIVTNDVLSALAWENQGRPVGSGPVATTSSTSSMGAPWMLLSASAAPAASGGEHHPRAATASFTSAVAATSPARRPPPRRSESSTARSDRSVTTGRATSEPNGGNLVTSSSGASTAGAAPDDDDDDETNPPTFTASGGRVVPMSTRRDAKNASRYQCLLREQIEFFEADRHALQAKAQGRNVPIRLGQVGIRCVHCSEADPRGDDAAASSASSSTMVRGAVYYPAKLSSLYQAVQNMANNHFANSTCPRMPRSVVEAIIEARRTRPKRSGGRGKRYFSQSAEALGVVNAPDGSSGLVMVRGANEEGVEESAAPPSGSRTTTTTKRRPEVTGAATSRSATAEV